MSTDTKQKDFRDDDGDSVRDALGEWLEPKNDMYEALFKRLAARAKREGYSVVYAIATCDPLSDHTMFRYGKAGPTFECAGLASALDRWMQSWIDE